METLNDTARRYPRDMNQAFGPDCNKHITEPDRPYDWQDKLVMTGCVLTMAALGIVWCLT